MISLSKAVESHDAVTAVEAVGAAAVDVVKGRAVLLRWRTRSVSSSISRRLF